VCVNIRCFMGHLGSNMSDVAAKIPMCIYVCVCVLNVWVYVCVYVRSLMGHLGLDLSDVAGKIPMYIYVCVFIYVNMCMCMCMCIYHVYEYM